MVLQRINSRRECQEETGSDIDMHELLCLYSDPASQTHRYPNGRVVHYVGAVFLASPRSRTGTPDGEATELGWSSLDALHAPILGRTCLVLSDASRRQHGLFIN